MFSAFQISRGLASGRVRVPRHYGADAFAIWSQEPWRFIGTLLIYLFGELLFGFGLIVSWQKFRDALRGTD
jgi:hypothetical protein